MASTVKPVIRIAVLILILTLSACNMFAPETSVQTLVAQRDLQSTQAAGQRATATAVNERLRVTLEAAQTAVTSAEIQSTRISATMIANGTAIVDIRFITPEASSSGADTINPVGGQSVAIIPAQGGAQGNIQLQPPTPTPPPIQVNPAITQPTPDPNGPSLTDISVAEQVGADDCALNPQISFTDAVTQLYVVATAANIPSGTPIAARFMRENVEQIRYDWSPGFNIVRGCIWFQMPASDVTLSIGTWSVALDLNGQQVGAPLTFQITSSGTDPMLAGEATTP